MTDRSVVHSTFVIARDYPFPPARVFAAWSEQSAKARWYLGLEGMKTSKYELDFRVGGCELARGGPPGGPVFAAQGRFMDIVADARIIYVYQMDRDGTPISASLTTVEFKPHGSSTRLVLTEQGAYLDGEDVPASRESGIRAQLENLARELEA